MRKTRIMAALVFGLVVAPVFAQDSVELSWKFNKGDKFFQEMVTSTNQTMTIISQEVKQDQEQTFLFSWTVKDTSDEGTIIEQKIEAVKMNIKIGGQEIKYDSTAKDAADNPLATFFKPLVGASFTLTIGPDYKVTKVEGREEFVNKMVQANPVMANLLKEILREDQLRQMSEPAFLVVQGQGKPVKAGDQWSNSSMLSLGPIGSYDAKYNYTYKGTVERGESKFHEIGMTTDLTYKAPEAGQTSELQFKIEKADLKTTSAEGNILFDAEKGRVVETSMKVSLEGELEISVGDQKSTVKLKQDQSTTTKTMDTNPYEKQS